VLVDTAGRSPSDAGVRDLLRLVGRRRGVHASRDAADTSARPRAALTPTGTRAPIAIITARRGGVDRRCSASSASAPCRLVGFAAGQRVPRIPTGATAALLAAAVLRDPLSYERAS
jgi:hypothetical protein